ncbi:MAG: ABC transporter permease [Candidatus Acidiferrales bacterium]
MPMLPRMTSFLRNTFGKRRSDRELDDEVHSYVDLLAAEKMREGMNPEEARRAARLELGGVEQVKEQVREVRAGASLDSLLQDLRYGARMLRKNPGFTAVAVLTLALGIGMNTAIFSVVDTILFKSLPYPHSNRIVMIWDNSQQSRLDVTFHTFRELTARSRSFEAAAVLQTWQPNLTSNAQPERLDGQSVSADYFRVLGIGPAFGRDFQPSDDASGSPKVVIISYGLWRSHFGADAAIFGRQITLDGELYTVIGVMPPQLETVLAPSAQVWTPLRYDTRTITTPDAAEWGHHLRMVALLRSDTPSKKAARELNGIAAAPVSEFPRLRWASLENGLIVDSLQADLTRGVRPALLALLGAVMLVLLIACVNVTNLLLARGAQRRGEFVMRSALGAGRARMIRQLLTESLLLSTLGGALGILVAEMSVKGLVALSPSELPRTSAISVDGTVFAFALGITAVIGLLAGVIPAIVASREDLHVGLQEASSRTSSGHQLTRNVLVVAEVALALVLLVSAGLLLHSLDRLFAVAPGFNSSHLVTLQVQTSGHRYDDPDATRLFFAQALAEVRRVPGVAAAGFTSLLPLSADQFGAYGAQFENDSPGTTAEVFRYAVSPGYLETMEIPLRRGRLLDERDIASAPPAALVSESLARRKFPDQDPVGKRLHIGPTDKPWYTIVGIVGNVKQSSLAAGDSDAAYITPAQSWFADDAMSLVVRARGNAASLAPAIRNAIWSIDKGQPITRVATMDDLVAASAAQRRFALILFEAFGIVALILAGCGIYGVLSGSVTERTREIGIRSALGASQRNIMALVIRRGLSLTALGVVIGLFGAAAASHAIVTLLFGISRLDPITYLAVIALLALVSGLACWIPAWRASRIDPAVTLRPE